MDKNDIKELISILDDIDALSPFLLLRTEKQKKAYKKFKKFSKKAKKKLKELSDEE